MKRLRDRKVIVELSMAEAQRLLKRANDGVRQLDRLGSWAYAKEAGYGGQPGIEAANRAQDKLRAAIHDAGGKI